MIIAVALLAAFLGWFVAARTRANEQDEIIAALNDSDNRDQVNQGPPGHGRWVRALQMLRESKPGIVIDSNLGAVHWPGEGGAMSPEADWADRASADFPWLKASFWTKALPDECREVAW